MCRHRAAIAQKQMTPAKAQSSAFYPPVKKRRSTF
jgi:hypothetical protein